MESIEMGRDEYLHENGVSRIIKVEGNDQLLFEQTQGQVIHVIEDMTEDCITGELDQDSRIFVVQDQCDENDQPAEIAVWNSDKSEYELLSSDFNDLAHQIMDILDKDPNLNNSAHHQNEEAMNCHHDIHDSGSASPQNELEQRIDEDQKNIPENTASQEDSASLPNAVSVSDENDKNASKMIQLETATGRIIQLPGEEDNAGPVNDKKSPNQSASEDEDQETTELPFACTLCKKRFSRKLHLNNHMERHHGIKFVFTEKGRKVKLVRIPEGFRVIEGEKLDPCVEKLITTIDKEKLHSIIGVEEIEPDETEQGQGGGNGNHSDGDDGEEDVNRLSDLFNGNIQAPFGCGFLFPKMNYQAYRIAMAKGEEPFAVFYPPDRTNVYLFRVLPAGLKHLLYPATKRDVRNAMGAKKDEGNYIIPLVAAIKTIGTTADMKMILEPLPAVKPSKVEILSFDDFVLYARQCQGVAVKSLADSIEVSPSPSRPPIVVDAAPKLRKKFQRRTTRASLKETKGTSDLCTGNVLDSPVSRAKKTARSRGLIADAKLQRTRRNLKKEFDDEFEEDDDEEKDASYYPNDSNRPKKRGRGRPPGTKNKPKL